MEQSYLMPGQERWESFRDANGVPKVRYSYCSLKGQLFRCVSRSREEAERLCEDWLGRPGPLLPQLKIRFDKTAVQKDDARQSFCASETDGLHPLPA